MYVACGEGQLGWGNVKLHKNNSFGKLWWIRCWPSHILAAPFERENILWNKSFCEFENNCVESRPSLIDSLLLCYSDVGNICCQCSCSDYCWINNTGFYFQSPFTCSGQWLNDDDNMLPYWQWFGWFACLSSRICEQLGAHPSSDLSASIFLKRNLFLILLTMVKRGLFLIFLFLSNCLPKQAFTLKIRDLAILQTS